MPAFYDECLNYRANLYANYLNNLDNSLCLILTSTVGWILPGNKRKIYSELVTEKLIRIRPYFYYKDFIYFNFKKFINKVNPDLVHLYDGIQFLPYWVAKYCKKKNIPFIYEHEQRHFSKNIFGLARFYFVTRWQIKFLANNARIIRVANEGSKIFLEKICAEKVKNKIIKSPIGYPKNIFFYDFRIEQNERDRLGIAINETILCTTGKFIRDKQVHNLIREFIASKKDNWLLIVQGIATDDYWAEIIKAANGCPRVLLRRELLSPENLNKLINICDYAIFTSATTSYFEALGSGSKILVPNGSATDLLEDEFIIKYGDIATIDYVKNLIVNKDVIREIFKKIDLQQNKKYKKISQHQFSDDHVCKELLREYQSIINV